MTEEDTPVLTDKQAQIVAMLPAPRWEIEEKLGIAKTTVHGHFDRLREKGVNLEYDEVTKEWSAPNQPKIRRVATKHTGTKTREANDWANEMEHVILSRLQSKDALIAPLDVEYGNEDLVLHMTDTHMGDVVEDEHGIERFNPMICAASIEHVTEKTLLLKDMMEARVDFDVCHILWGGDMLTNENIYDGQAFDISAMLADQMSMAVDALTLQAKTMAEAFDTVQIVAQPGNHGKTRASGVSKQANMDLLAYRWIEDRLAESGYDNINFVQSEAAHFRNFQMRDGKWKGHLRHEGGLKHIGTASGQNRWRGWREQFRFDVGYRGHWHMAKTEEVLNQYPVIMSPSMKPGGEFASKIGMPDVSTFRKLATIHGVSDDRPLTWSFVLDDIELTHD